MKIIRSSLSAVAIAISFQSHACSVFLQDTIQLPSNSEEISNSDRLAITRHYLIAREWTEEGTSVEVDVAAFESECNPRALAALRAENIKTFLMQLGLDKNDIHVSERIIKLNNGQINPDDRWQIGIEFSPKCPPMGCDYLCNTPKASPEGPEQRE